MYTGASFTFTFLVFFVPLAYLLAFLPSPLTAPGVARCVLTGERMNVPLSGAYTDLLPVSPVEGSVLPPSDRVPGIEEVVVAVVDSGVDPSHPALRGVTVLPGWDPVDPCSDGRVDVDGHGTTAAALLAGEASSPVHGTAPGVTVLPVRVLSGNGGELDAGSFTVGAGVVWAVRNGADVVNLSLGSARFDPATWAAVRYAEERGVLVVAAAGNHGRACAPGERAACGNRVEYPARYETVLAVGSVDSAGVRSDFSTNRGYVDVLARGDLLLAPSLERSSPWVYESGTSFAAPQVAGEAARLLAADPGLTPAELRDLLRDGSAWSGHLVSAPGPSPVTGSSPEPPPLDLSVAGR